MPFIDYEPFKPQEICNHPQHHPPTMIVLRPGTHTYRCPACGKTQTFVVPAITCSLLEQRKEKWQKQRKLTTVLM